MRNGLEPLLRFLPDPSLAEGAGLSIGLTSLPYKKTKPCVTEPNTRVQVNSDGEETHQETEWTAKPIRELAARQWIPEAK